MVNTLGQNRKFYKLGLIGHPVSHSLSPLMHRAALSFCHLNGDYVAIDIAPPLAPDSIQSLIADGYVGLNVTIPHKQAVLPYMGELTPDASAIQAVNTIAIGEDGMLIGHNTDVGGFRLALEESLMGAYGRECLLDLGSSAAVIAGAGGAARAAVAGLVQLGVGHVYLVTRRFEQAHQVSIDRSFSNCGESRVQAVAIEDFGSLKPINILVNSTPVGLTDQTIPGWLQTLLHNIALTQKAEPGASCFVYDMVYSARQEVEPAVVSLARSLGLPAANGLGMLINQACLAFEFWTGVPIAADVMCEALVTTSAEP